VRMEQIQAQINQMLQQGQSTAASSLSNPRNQTHDNDNRDSRQPSH
jgi:hypothetical protein